MLATELRDEYDRRLPTYLRASKNVREAIELLLLDRGIATLAVLTRVKSFESFIEKVARKSYTNPFDEATDFVGIRLILYFPKDIDVVRELLSKELDVLESSNKSELLKANEFGYRSHHLLIRIPEAWASTPNYRGLERVTIEVQLRTVLMHAWAEIEHKLQYKSSAQVPHGLKRKLFLLSAKVEEADDQFQSLVADVGEYRKEIAIKAAKTGSFDTALPLNLDTLKELLAFFYPQSEPHDFMAQNLFNDIVSHGISLARLVECAKSFQPYESILDSMVSHLTSAAKFSYALDVFAPKFRGAILYTEERNRIIDDLIEIISKGKVDTRQTLAENAKSAPLPEQDITPPVNSQWNSRE